MSACVVLVLAALGCGGQSKSAFHDWPSTGGSSGDGGKGGKGASGGSSGSGSGSGGSGAKGGDAGSGAAGDTGGGGTGATAGNGATSGQGGTPNAGASGYSGGGASAAGAGTGGGGGVEPVGPLSGAWGMFWFEDPVAVSIGHRGQALTGEGCCTGLPGGPVPSPCCGPLEGTCTGGKANFALSLDGVGAVYSTDVYVAEDYQRMGGAFSADGNASLAVAWVRLDAGQTNLGAAPPAISEALMPRAGGFELMLSSAFVGRFEPGTPVELQVSALGFIRGAFGPFYWGDMSWDAATQTLTVGPVPATDPSYATRLELRFDGNALKSVHATYPGDPTYAFAVTGTTG